VDKIIEIMRLQYAIYMNQHRYYEANAIEMVAFRLNILEEVVQEKEQ
jgi:hypothetical protein